MSNYVEVIDHCCQAWRAENCFTFLRQNMADSHGEEINPCDGDERQRDSSGAINLAVSLSRGPSRARELNEQANVNGERFQFVEAERSGAWFKAIEKRDCLSLLKELRSHHAGGGECVSLFYETGEQRRTALHVAAMQGCFRLAKRLIDLICEKFPCSQTRKLNEGTEDGTSRERGVYVSEVAFEFMEARDGRSGLTAFEMANDIIGNTSISQYILYVRMESEKKKEYGGMYEAYEGTEWGTALGEGDCSRLKLLLIYGNSRLLLQTCDGMSVLDVAILKDDKELVEVVVSAFGPARDKISWHAESHFPSELTWEWMVERHFGGWDDDVSKRHGFHLGATAQKLAELGLGRVKTKAALDSVKSALDLAEKLGSSEVIKGLLEGKGKAHVQQYTDVIGREDRVELLEALSTQGMFELGLTEPLESTLPECGRLFDLAKFIDRYWESEWTAEFLADVDYNFEEKSSLRFSILRMHYIFKDAVKCEYFSRSFIAADGIDCSLVVCLMFDGQGRTPFHTMVDNYNPSWSAGMSTILDVLFRWAGFGYLREHDSRGRSPLVRSISKQFLHKDTMASVLETLFDGLDLGPCIGDKFRTRSLLMAAATGSPPILRMCLKSFDPMIEDGKGKTALHYAVDANMFKFFHPPLSFYCSIDHRIKVEDHWVKKHKEEVQSNANVGRRACILMLLQAGVDLSQEDKKGDIPDPGTSSEPSFQSWWYDTLVKDTVEKKNSFNQAGNALSVVGTLVAATSYIGPLQPPLSYDSVTGYVETSRLLVKVFMVSNTLAFYLAVASVMFAVVPSLPMPQEGVIDELRRARHTVSSSLFLLLTSIGCILVSFAAASAVVVDDEHYYGSSDFLLKPSIIGWVFCVIAMVSFFIRVMRLVFYRSSVVRGIYKFSFSAFLKKAGTAIRSYSMILRHRFWIWTIFHPWWFSRL